MQRNSNIKDRNEKAYKATHGKEMKSTQYLRDSGPTFFKEGSLVLLNFQRNNNAHNKR